MPFIPGFIQTVDTFGVVEGVMMVMKKSQGGKVALATANREAIYSLVLAGMNFVWWYLMAYRLGDGPVEGYTYVMGLPSWFFYSCIVGFVLFALFATAMVQFFFTEVPLDEDGTPREKG